MSFCDRCKKELTKDNIGYVKKDGAARIFLCRKCCKNGKRLFEERGEIIYKLTELENYEIKK